ncbi:cell wall hydrolase [Pseudalkalibacillus decolorationis]|uniref:cell wall hydrolase n=1 Tax=Pseudalkalibacillus decolorationis TaxID=163879 RepID=UPI002149214F|nr:cell wall hydrolase [Pseudalkalibacillus decolorationis]
MDMHSKGVKVFLSILFVVGAIVSVPTVDANAQKDTVEVGDRYGYVWDLQHRLQQLGYFEYKMDGEFGLNTKHAIIRFQQENGLKEDGVVGPQSWAQLYMQSFTVNEIQMMAQMVHGEARGESFKGQVAVASVILNRLHSDKFPDKVKHVLFEDLAFTAIADGQYYSTPDKESYRAVYEAIRGWDPTGNAVYYFNPETATSEWIWSRTQTTKIGNHIFAK